MGPISEKPKVQPQDDAADLLSAVLKTLRVLGSITNRRPEAEGLSIAILDTFGKK